MTEIGVRDLKSGASGILKKVHENRARYIVTCRGKAIGAIVPVDSVDQEAGGRQGEDAWDELLDLAGKAAAAWKGSKSPAEVLSEIRR